MPYTKEEHQQASAKIPRDSSGHFASPRRSPAQLDEGGHNSSVASALKKLITPGVSKTTDEDTLIDVHVNNPLKKIVELLQDIKKQKAFSFTLKGSLGIMGVALALSAFGIFGGAKMLCDKGIQTQVGILKELDSTSIERSNVPIIGQAIDYYHNLFTSQNTTTQKKRVILLKDDRSTIFLPNTRGVLYESLLNQPVYTTGQYDSCSQTLKPQSPSDLQLFQ